MLNIRSAIVLLVIVASPQFGLADAPPAGRRLAVVVGVNSYRPNSGLSPLNQAVNDAARLSAVLRSSGFTVVEMTHDIARQPGKEHLAPNLDDIRHQISGILEFPNLGPDDAVLISLHGHGVQFDRVAQSNGMEVKTSQFFFCPADATVTDVKQANDLTERNHLLALDELYGLLSECQAATKLLIVDACRNDPSSPAVTRSLASSSMPKLVPPPGGIAAFFSCKANQQAIEDKDLQQGVFTHFLVKGLEGKADQPLEGRPADGVITISELTAYVANNTYAHVFEKYGGMRQSPDLKGEFDTNLPLARIASELNGTKAGDLKTISLPKNVTLKLVWCPPGNFLMGSPESDQNSYDDEKPQVKVTLTKGFWLGQTEITQGQWQSVMGSSPWSGKDYVQEGTDFPATYISHGGDRKNPEGDSAQAFCLRLTEQERAAGRIPTTWAYRLPTEAEWEYACRAGTTARYSFGDDEEEIGKYAWFDSNTDLVGELYAHRVGQKRPNPWGVFDLHGNVWEWCEDAYEMVLPGGRDPVGDSGSNRVYRGGGWGNTAGNCRSAVRVGFDPSLRNSDLGFRVALSPSVQ